jgi:hypothetical protein
MDALQVSMSAPPEPEFDLEKLFLPAWAQDSAKANPYANFAGEERHARRPDDRQGRRPPPRRDGPRDGQGRGPRPDGGGKFQGSRGRVDQGPRREPAPPPAPLPEINVTILPDENGVDSLARQIRITGRAYPLFDIAQLILQRPERLQGRFEIKKNAEGQPVQPLFVCALDDTLWLSEEEAVEHILRRHFETFYQAERTATEPPRGTYTFVGQCGMSGAILGPPNYHDYQNQLRKLHTERFARMPFEAFKARVKIVKDEAIVKKWIEDHSFKTEYNCLNVPEPRKLASRAEVEKHFRETHLPNLVRRVETQTLSGTAARGLQSAGLRQLWRVVSEEQRRFPLKLATVLSQQFASRGLQFFKVNRTVTHVSVARPHYLDMEATPVSEGVKKIVEFINAHPRSTRRKLVEALAPSPAPPPAPPAPAEGTPPAPAAEATAEQTALIGDLHWLIHQGHVIEFANGVLETAKRPLPKPPKPEKKPEAASPGEPAAEAPAEAAETAPASVPDLSGEIPGPSALAEAAAEKPEEAKPAEEATS